MGEFILKEIVNADIKQELEKIGFDKSYISPAEGKYIYKNFKIYGLTLPQANILKQTAISVGADCAIHREVITSKIETTDCILGGSLSQLNKIAEKLTHQPFGLKNLANSINQSIVQPFNRSTKLAGILNLTDNSFSDGGMYSDLESAKNRLKEIIEEGADIVDLGAESTKPFSQPVSAQEQLDKLLPLLEYYKTIQPFNHSTIQPFNYSTIQLSIDTRNAQVARECINAGATIINDISGLTYDEKMADIIAESGVKIIIQHSQGTPEDMQLSPSYESLMDELYLSLRERINFAISKGIKKENIIIDPGIGFGKTREHNFEILRRIEEFHGLGCPVMLGISRKSLLDMADADNQTKDIFTAALNTLAVERKVDYLRVHNVGLHRKLINLLSC